jgi:heme exporter protein D
MIKQILTLPLIFSSLYAEEIEEVQPLDPEVVQSLYIESALFVAVFILMSVVSIVISKKHAAQNLLDDQKKREAKAEAEKAQEAQKVSQASPVKESKESKRVKELSKMLKDGLISDEEFKILSHTSKVNSI